MSKSRQNVRPSTSSKSGAGDSRELTIYQGGFAKVEETRAFRTAAGDNQIQIDGLPAQYMRNSLLILSIAGDGEVVIESADFRAANSQPAQVLALSQGASINLKFRSNTGRQRFAEGTLIKAAGDKLFIRKNANGRVSMVNTGDIEELEFADGLPEGVSDTCYLLLRASATIPGAYQARILYRTGGLNWAASHSAIYDEKRGIVTKLESWVTLTNGAGVDFDGVKVKLLSGDITPKQDAYGLEAAPMAFAASAGGGPKRASILRATAESVGEQKLYTLPRRVSLLNGSAPQIPLFFADEVPVSREYFLPPVNAWQRQNQDAGLKPVSIRLRLVNDADHKLGTPLPAGEVSIYQADSEGEVQLTGSTSIDHVAQGESFGFVIGTSTDIKAERKLVESAEVAPAAPEGDRKFPLTEPEGGPVVAATSRRGVVQPPAQEEEQAPKYHDETWDVTVHNFKTDRSVEVVVMEEFPEKHEVRESSHAFAKEGTNRFSARLQIEPGEKTVLRYILRIQDN